MTPARLAVLALRLAALAAAILTLAMVVDLWLLPWPPTFLVRGSVIEDASPLVFAIGRPRFTAALLLVLSPLSAVPALLAVAVQRRIVVPQRISRRKDLAAAEAREQRLWSFLGDACSRLLNSPAPSADVEDLRRRALSLLHDLDEGRRRRLLLFSTLLAGEQVEASSADAETSQAGQRELRLAWVRPVLVLCLALSSFGFLWGPLAIAISRRFDLFASSLYPSEDLATGLAGCWGITLILLLAAVSLWRLHREALGLRRSAEAQARQRRQRTLRRWDDNVSPLLRAAAHSAGAAGRILRLACRALTLSTLPELDGEHRGLLLRSLAQRRALHGADRAVDLRGADLTGAHLDGADLDGARLPRTDLSAARLRNARLRGADLSGCRLARCDLRGADLTGADLFRAVLWYAHLHRADLSGACLTEAALDHANLWQADLTAADLDGARISSEQLAVIRRRVPP